MGFWSKFGKSFQQGFQEDFRSASRAGAQAYMQADSLRKAQERQDLLAREGAERQNAGLRASVQAGLSQVDLTTNPEGALQFAREQAPGLAESNARVGLFPGASRLPKPALGLELPGAPPTTLPPGGPQTRPVEPAVPGLPGPGPAMLPGGSLLGALNAVEQSAQEVLQAQNAVMGDLRPNGEALNRYEELLRSKGYDDAKVQASVERLQRRHSQARDQFVLENFMNRSDVDSSTLAQAMVTYGVRPDLMEVGSALVKARSLEEAQKAAAAGRAEEGLALSKAGELYGRFQTLYTTAMNVAPLDPDKGQALLMNAANFARSFDPRLADSVESAAPTLVQGTSKMHTKELLQLVDKLVLTDPESLEGALFTYGIDYKARANLQTAVQIPYEAVEKLKQAIVARSGAPQTGDISTGEESTLIQMANSFAAKLNAAKTQADKDAVQAQLEAFSAVSPLGAALIAKLRGMGLYKEENTLQAPARQAPAKASGNLDWLGQFHD